MSPDDEPIAPTATDITTGLGVIDEPRAIELLESTPIGRIGFVVDGHPLVLPVNFKWHEGTVVFRTLEGMKLDAAAKGQAVCFEVDRWDAAKRSGWSVVVIGTAREVTNWAEREQLENIGLVPWATGKGRPIWVRIDPEEISGRVLS
jgi:hypothetical protein